MGEKRNHHKPKTSNQAKILLEENDVSKIDVNSNAKEYVRGAIFIRKNPKYATMIIMFGGVILIVCDYVKSNGTLKLINSMEYRTAKNLLFC